MGEHVRRDWNGSGVRRLACFGFLSARRRLKGNFLLPVQVIRLPVQVKLTGERVRGFATFPSSDKNYSVNVSFFIDESYQRISSGCHILFSLVEKKEVRKQASFHLEEAGNRYT